MLKRLAHEEFYNKFYFQDSFYNQCIDVNPLSLIQLDRSIESVRKFIDMPIFKTATRVVGCGCGDSNIAAFVVKDAFEHYLPEVEYQGVEAIELSRHYDYPEDCSNMIGVFISFSGSVLRTREAMEQCRRHGVTTIGMTTSAGSPTATDSDIFYDENSPKGDNNAGNRTYCVNVLSAIVLAAAMAEVRTGHPHLAELREAVIAYHDRFFANFADMDKTCFRAAVHWMDKKYLEICADGPLFWSGKFIQAKVIELSGDSCSCIDSENYKHVNGIMWPGKDIAELVLINSNEPNVPYIVESVNKMLKSGREVLLFCDKAPAEIGVEGDVIYCHMPAPDPAWSFLQGIFAYLPGAVFAGFRHTTIGEPMFRGGFNGALFGPTYCAPMEIVDI